MPRLKPPREREPVFEAVEDLPTEDTIIELPDDDDVITLEAEGEVERTKPEPKPEPDDNPLQAALAAQQRAEELQRTAQRERDDALRQTRERDEELTRERGERQDAEYSSVLTAIAAETSALEKAESDYAAFASAGDWVNAGKAQRIMATAAARLDKLEDGKQAFEGRREASKTESSAPRQGNPQPKLDFEQRIAQLPDQAKTWLRRHPEYINDPTLNAKISSTHGYLINNKGIEAFSPAYFDALDSEFGFKAAAEPEPKAAPHKRSIPVSAPVSRDVPTANGERASPRTIKLSPAEIQIARNSFGPINHGSDLTNAEKELLYAKNKAKLLRMRANGEYRQTTEQGG